MKVRLAYVILGFIFLLALFPCFSFLKSASIPSGEALLPPSLTHWFGTDDLGIDIFAEICYGAKNMLTVSCISAFLAAITGSFLGMLAGYYGGVFDEILLGILNFFMSIPELLLMVLLGSMLGPSLRNIIFSIVLVTWVVPAKLVRSEILKQKQARYIQISKLYGASFLHLLQWHFWKPVFSIFLITVIRLMNRAILMEASLSYLGLGDPLSKSWGMIITRAIDFPNIYLTDFWKWWLLFPILFMVSMVLSVAVIGQNVEKTIGRRYRKEWKKY